MTAFTTDKRNRDGRVASCKACDNARVKAYNAKNREKVRAGCRRAYHKRRDKALPQFREWAAQHPLAAPARRAVRQAIRAGRLVMPDTCDGCLAFLDGRFECHHADYSHPLSVSTLCRSCHTIHHYQEAR